MPVQKLKTPPPPPKALESLDREVKTLSSTLFCILPSSQHTEGSNKARFVWWTGNPSQLKFPFFNAL